MENNFEFCPLEITEHIFSYLETLDIIHLSRTCQQFESICFNKTLNRTINLYRKYQISTIEFCQYVLKQPRYEVITTLNISCMFWIPAAELRKCLSKMTSLHSLYAVDTKLSLLKSDYVLYKGITTLKKLAVSTSKRTFFKEDILYYFPKVSHFYLHLDSSCEYIIKTVVSTIARLKTVEELWLIESGSSDISRMNVFVYPPENLKKFTYVVSQISFCLAEGAYLNRWFKSSLNGMQACWGILELDIHRSQFETNGNKYWEHLLTLFRNDSPFSLKQTKELMLEKASLEAIIFDELNFLHGDFTCGSLYKNSIDTVLLYPNMRMLRKLSLSFCACLDTEDYLEIIETTKKRRLEGVSVCLLQKISENSPYIEELELWSCKRVDTFTRITENSINCITNFSNLKKLTLDNIPHYVSPSFLINICTSCRHLTSLRIKSRQQNSSLHNMFCLALQKTVSLKDLRYEHPCNISIDRLFDALTQNKNLKLERLFIKCKSVEIFSAKPFQSYLQSNGELKFLCIVIKDLPKNAITRINKSLETFKQDPQKIIVITQDEANSNSRIYVPNFHIFEMVRCATNVCVLDVFNGFVKQ